MGTVVQHPSRLRGSWSLRARLNEELSAQIASATALMREAKRTLAEIVRRTDRAAARRLLEEYEDVFAEFAHIVSAPLPVLTDLAALSHRLMAVSDSMEELRDPKDR